MIREPACYYKCWRKTEYFKWENFVEYNEESLNEYMDLIIYFVCKEPTVIIKRDAVKVRTKKKIA